MFQTSNAFLSKRNISTCRRDRSKFLQRFEMIFKTIFQITIYFYAAPKYLETIIETFCRS